MLIDLHTHTTPKSDDSLLSPTELIIQAKRAGLDGICLTEHDSFWSQEPLAHLSQELNFLLIPGAEINTEEGHIIVFGVDEYQFGMHHASFLRNLLDKRGGFMILAHPYRRNFYVDSDINAAADQYYQKPVFRYVDTVEVLNGQGKDQQNSFSQELSRRLGWKGVGGSDAHEGKDIPTYATCFERKIRSREELIQELKAGRYQAADLRRMAEK